MTKFLFLIFKELLPFIIIIIFNTFCIYKFELLLFSFKLLISLFEIFILLLACCINSITDLQRSMKLLICSSLNFI